MRRRAKARTHEAVQWDERYVRLIAAAGWQRPAAVRSAGSGDEAMKEQSHTSAENRAHAEEREVDARIAGDNERRLSQ